MFSGRAIGPDAGGGEAEARRRDEVGDPQVYQHGSFQGDSGGFRRMRKPVDLWKMLRVSPQGPQAQPLQT